MTSAVESIGKAASELANQIREYVLSQQHLWQQVPWLALQADGRSGYLDDYARAYKLGFWAITGIRGESGEGYAMYIDLATGMILNAGSTHWQKTGVPADDSVVLRLATELDLVDAQGLVDMLKEEGQKETHEFYDPAKQDRWREEMRERYNVQVLYTGGRRARILDPIEGDVVEGII